MKLEITKNGEEITAIADLDLLLRIKFELVSFLNSEDKEEAEKAEKVDEHLDKLWNEEKMWEKDFGFEVSFDDKEQIENLEFLTKKLRLDRYTNHGIILGR